MEEMKAMKHSIRSRKVEAIFGIETGALRGTSIQETSMTYGVLRTYSIHDVSRARSHQGMLIRSTSYGVHTYIYGVLRAPYESGVCRTASR